MWLLILWVNLTGQVLPRLNIISRCLRGCWWMRSAFELVHSVKSIALPCVGGYHLICWRPGKKTEEGGIWPFFMPQCMSENISLLFLPLVWDLSYRLPWFSGLWTWAEWHHWLFWVFRLQTADHGISQLPYHLMCLLIILYVLYIQYIIYTHVCRNNTHTPYCFCLSGDPWLIQRTVTHININTWVQWKKS